MGRPGRLKIDLAAAGRSAHNGDLQNDEPTGIIEVGGWRRAAVWLLALLVRTWGRTLRFEVDPESLRCLTKSDEPALIALWHNRLFLSAEMFRRYRTRRHVYGLVSASQDGAWLAAFYRMIGIIPVRGSSSNLGREAARLLIERMREGHDVGITPDGPRGPLYVVEPGVLVVARRLNAPILLFGAEFGPAWRLRSWDRFAIPWPFTRVRMRSGIFRPRDESGAKLGADDLRAALLAVNPDPPDVL